MIIINPFSTDIITNSSSVVYSMATSVDSLHDFIDEILKHFGTDKKSRDVFDIVIVPDMENLSWGEVPDGISEHFSDISSMEWSKSVGDLYVNRAVALLNSGVINVSDFGNCDGYYQSSYVVKEKNGNATNIGELIFGLLDHQEVYNG